MECAKCKKKLKETDKIVLWKTYQGKKIYEEVYWHFKCFIEWRDESLTNRAMKLYQKSMQNIIPQFQDFLKKVVPNSNEETPEILKIGIGK